MALDFPSSPTNGQTYSANNITWVYETSTTTWNVQQDGVTGKTKVARIYEAKAHNTAAGSPADTAYYDRILNTKDDPHGFVSWPAGASLGTGGTNTYFSLTPGSYKINWRAPAHDGNGCRTRLVYANNGSFTSSSEVLGESGYSDTASAESNYYSCGTAIVTTTELTYFKIQQAQASGDWGQACAVGGDEIYTQVFVEDLATVVKEPSGTEVPVGGIIMYSGTQTALNELTHWKLCDGTNGTPNLKDKFVIGADQYSSGWKTNVTGSLTDSGGSKDAVVVQHNHTYVTKGATFTGDFHDEATGAWRTDSTVNTGDSGESGTNKNLPPYYALAYIMRVS